MRIWIGDAYIDIVVLINVALIALPASIVFWGIGALVWMLVKGA